jgi:plastocyanin
VVGRLAEAPPKGFGLSLAVAVVALFLAVGAIAFAYVGSSSQVSTLQSEVGQLQSQVGKIPTSLSVINATPITRNILVEWEATLPSLQDRWLPQMLVINQGDSIHLLVESNDTDGAHTWTIEAPTGPGGALQETQLNVSVVGQWMYFPPREAGPQFGTEIKGPATGCVTMNQNVTCNTTGGCSINAGPIANHCTGSFLLPSNETETASIQASTTLGPFLTPGVYRYFCFYHQDIGMVGYLIVLPNVAAGSRA